MKVPIEVQCKTCGQVFCCAKCRQKHEDNSHQEMKAIRQICYICNNRPFPLRIDTKITPTNLLVQHIMAEHLPLRCNRCSKVFLTASDFKTLPRCTPFAENDANTMDHVCSLERSPNIPTIQEIPVENSIEVENKENIDENNRTDTLNHSNADRSSKTIPATAIKTKALITTPAISKELLAITDPIEEIGEPNEALLTPLTKINLRWKRKSRLSFDSMNASNNISAVITCDAGQLSPGKKMARTTSTPMVGAVVPKMKCSNESNASALGQMSSIHNSGNESDSRNDDHTPISPTSYELEKVRAIVKSRSKAVATPLRHVMSKSIQRAIAQHTHYSKMLAPGTQRKMSFNSTGSSDSNSTVGSPSRKALDLRTTPVLKRSSSESSFGNHKNAKISCPSKAHSEDSSLYQLDDVSRPISEYFETHQNEASLEKTDNVDQENRDNHKIVEQSMIASEFAKLKAFPSYYQDTPKIAGAMLKKAISFTTPEMTRIGEHHLDPNETVDVWATPCSIPPRSFSCSALQDTGLKSFLHNGNDTSNSDDVFLPPTRLNSHHKLKKEPSAVVPSTGKLWTIVSNVIRLASRTDIREDLGTDSPEYSSGSDSGSATFSLNLAQKASSFAGFLRNRLPGRQTTCTSSELDEPSSFDQSGTKRRRTNSVYTRPYETIGNASMRPTSSPLAKRKRIQGRQPIERMRKNSSRASSGSDV
ncbi:mitosis initiation protein fs(1)Ya [Ochlerotatus camptorhynchus]|uniref:mitosis initiation protein fs(1)Ya n=1 Tax=Ochlerotatus camptorhynchus TaxID=644619 RepID=UPI0031DE0C90